MAQVKVLFPFSLWEHSWITELQKFWFLAEKLPERIECFWIWAEQSIESGCILTTCQTTRSWKMLPFRSVFHEVWPHTSSHLVEISESSHLDAANMFNYIILFNGFLSFQIKKTKKYGINELQYMQSSRKISQLGLCCTSLGLVWEMKSNILHQADSSFLK